MITKTPLATAQSLLIWLWCITIVKHSAAKASERTDALQGFLSDFQISLPFWQNNTIVSLQCPDKGPLKVLVRNLPRDQAFVLCHLLNRIQMEGGGYPQQNTGRETFARKPQLHHPPREGQGYWTYSPARQPQRQMNNDFAAQGFQYSPKHLTTPDVQTLRYGINKLINIRF